jgi:2Fe-2S ferredoxin
MPQIIVLPHEELCPDGAVLEAGTGTTVLDALLANDIPLEHACEKSCACTTCHVYVREGGESLADAEETEEDLLDKAWGLDPDSRLGCQAVVNDKDLVVEIPKYTINMVSEGHH